MLKADWIEHLHKFRTRELEIVFKQIDKKFQKGLELGAGDGFQSQLLINYVDSLIATDLNGDRLPTKSNFPNIQYLVLDAEKVGSAFEPKSFDIVFSSNLMEHLPNVHNCFNGIHQILKDDGIAIHVMPSPNWRLFATILHFPNKLYNLLDVIFFGRKRKKGKGNNLKLNAKRQSRIKNFFIPKPHGISSNFISEFFAFRRKKWINDFEETNFKVLKIIPGPVSSGYGFGWDRLRMMLENLGIATEYIYFVQKK